MGKSKAILENLNENNSGCDQNESMHKEKVKTLIKDYMIVCDIFQEKVSTQTENRVENYASFENTQENNNKTPRNNNSCENRDNGQSNENTDSKADDFIENYSGCGSFQILLIFFVTFIGNCSTEISLVFMPFGAFNPGWYCSDNLTSSMLSPQHRNQTRVLILNDNIINKTQMAFYDSEYGFHLGEYNNLNDLTKDTPQKCSRLENCHNIVFNPSSSTIVTEFALVCDKARIPSQIGCIEMVATMIGCVIAGYVGDKFGRKHSFFGAMAVLAVLNFTAIFAQTWEIYALFRFGIGLCCSFGISLNPVFAAEFVPNKWRGILQGIPIWITSSAIGTLIFMVFKNWRQVHIATAISGVIGLLPAFYFPESLRWLEARNHFNEFEKAAKKILRCNNKPKHAYWNFNSESNQQTKAVQINENYNILHLFTKRYRTKTLALSFLWLIIMLTSHSLGYGMGILHGDFYVDYLIIYSVQIPFAIVPIILPNLIGRKPTSYIFVITSGFSFLIAMFLEFFGPDNVKSFGILFCMFVAAVAINFCWGTVCTMTMEIYPTVVRALAVSCTNSVGRLGSALAPFVFPTNPEFVYITFIVMAVLNFSCIILISLVPETRGVELRESYYDSIPGENE